MLCSDRESALDSGETAVARLVAHRVLDLEGTRSPPGDCCDESREKWVGDGVFGVGGDKPASVKGSSVVFSSVVQ